MDKLSTLKNILETIWEFITVAVKFTARAYGKAWLWLRLRLPFLEALVKRHAANPATIFVDIAIVILIFYVTFGIVGYILIYPQKAESRFATNLAALYPLPAARVNDSFVWSHRFLERLSFLNTFNSQSPPDATVKPPVDSELRQRVIEGLIEDKIIFLEAKKRGIRVTEKEVQKAFEQQGDAKEIRQKIKNLYGMSIAQFKAIIAEQILKERVKNATLTRIRVSHILTTSLSAAIEAKKQVELGRDFAAVATEFSQDGRSKNEGGDLGYWRKGELVSQISPAFEEAAFSMSVGQLSEPIQTQFGYHIITVVERSGDNLQTYEQWYKERRAEYLVKQYIKI